MQDCSNSSVLAMELLQSYTEPAIQSISTHPIFKLVAVSNLDTDVRVPG